MSQDILNLIYRFGAHFDAGAFDAALDLFKEGAFLLGEDQRIGPGEMGALWRETVLLYDGVPRTRHVISNSSLEIDKDGQAAQCRSVYVVYQEAPGLPLQVILCGRYHDAFVKRDGVWRFGVRDYRLVDLVGDVSRHLRPAMAERLMARARAPLA